MMSGLQDESADHSDEAHHGPDREIDAAREDHGRHADRHDADEREIASDVVEIVGGREGVRLIPGHDRAHNDEGDRDPKWLAGRQALAEASLLEPSDIVD